MTRIIEFKIVVNVTHEKNMCVWVLHVFDLGPEARPGGAPRGAALSSVVDQRIDPPRGRGGASLATTLVRRSTSPDASE